MMTPRASDTHTRFIATAVSLIDGATVTVSATHRSPYGAWAGVAAQLFARFGHVDYRVIRGTVFAVPPPSPSLAPSRPVAPSLGAGRWLW